MARFIFLDDHSKEFFANWETAADSAAAILRVSVGRAPHDRDLSNLIGELATRSDEFSHRWAQHNVKAHFRGVKRFRHSLVGQLTLGYESMVIPGGDELMLVAYVATPSSPSDGALKLLASWAAAGDESRATTPVKTDHTAVAPHEIAE